MHRKGLGEGRGLFCAAYVVSGARVRRQKKLEWRNLVRPESERGGCELSIEKWRRKTLIQRTLTGYVSVLFEVSYVENVCRCQLPTVDFKITFQ